MGDPKGRRLENDRLGDSWVVTIHHLLAFRKSQVQKQSKFTTLT